MRALKIILATMLVLLLIAGSALWLNRTRVAERVLNEYIAAEKIPIKSLRVSAISPNRIALNNLVLVTDDPDPITVEFDGEVEISREKDGVVHAMVQDGLLTLSRKEKNLLLPLTLDAKASKDGDNITMSGTFHNERRNVDGSFEGSYSLEDQQGQAQWKTKPMTFSPDGFTFAQLSPAYAEDFTTFASKMSVSGTVNMQPGSWTATPRITIYEMPIEALLKDVLGEGTKISGTIKGEVPVRIAKGGAWRIEPSDLENIGDLHIALGANASSAAALSSHPQAGVVKEALSNLQVEAMSLRIRSTDDKGGVKMDWHFKGRNPDYLGGKAVDLNLAVTANLRDMWRSAVEVKRLQREAEQELRKKIK